MKKLCYSILTIVLCLLLHLISSEYQGSPKADDEILDDLRPLHYDLEFITYPRYPQPKFWGTVTITVECRRRTNKIILHQAELEIQRDVKVKLSGSKPASFHLVKRHDYDDKSEQYTITLWKSLLKGKIYEIKIRFSRPSNIASKFTDSGYLFQYYDRDWPTDHKEPWQYRESKLMIYTSMDVTAARRVFPCFDQLDMKATFKIKHTHRSIMNGLSNADKISTKPVWQPYFFRKDEYTKTVRMEASSVAIVLLQTDFAWTTSTYTHSRTRAQTDIRIFAENEIFEKVRYIVGLATEIFRIFSDYFEVPYPFTKLDIIASPRLATNVETDYGVIRVSEAKILRGFEDIHLARYEIVSELCHAISQQWIGHTVTINRWIDNSIHLALNLFLQTQCAIEIEPKWERKFIQHDIIHSFMNLAEVRVKDALDSFLVVGIAPEYLKDDANRILKKDFHFIRMVHLFLGRNVFQKGINNYVDEFKFSNSKYGDLWVMLTNTANAIEPHLLPNISVGEIISSWVLQAGYPLITVTWEHDTKQIFISQTAFNEGIPNIKFEDRCWLIPLSYTTTKESEHEVDSSLHEWLTCKGLHLNVDMDEGNWLLLDLQVSVNMRVNYDKSIWIAIQKSLVNNENPQVFHTFTRARLISDMFFFARTGDLPYPIVLDAMRYLPDETYSGNWIMALREFDKIRLLLMRSSVYEYFKKYVQGILQIIFDRNGYQDLTQTAVEDLDLKVAIVEYSCRYGVEACRRKSVELVKKWKKGAKDLDSLPDDLQKAIHCQAVKHGRQSHWDTVLKLFEQEKEPHKKANLLYGLCCSKSTGTLKQFLEWSLDKNNIAVGYSRTIFQNLAANRNAYKLLRKFFMNNINQITQLWEKPENVYEYWIQLFNTTVEKTDLVQLQQFADRYDAMEIQFVGLPESRQQAEKNLVWLQQNEEIMKTYFRDSTPRKLWGLF